MAANKIHVVTHDDGWAVKMGGESEVSSSHPTQKEAIDAGRRLSKEQEADLVVHRQDGTFRNVISFHEMDESSRNGSESRRSTREDATALPARDVLSVGSRISWSALLAGAFITTSVFITLGVLGVALGMTSHDAMSQDTTFLSAAAWSLGSTLVALFVGGYVTSRTTVGEDKTEALGYGVVLWGLMFVVLSLLSATGVGFGYHALVEQMNVQQVAEKAANQVSPSRAAWWTFGIILGSMVAAVLGSLVGAGPELVVAQLRERREKLVRQS